MKPQQDAIRPQVATLNEVAATLDPTQGGACSRQSKFDAILARLVSDDDPIHQRMASLMPSFRVGLFAGGDDRSRVQDNLDLERWFRLPSPKGTSVESTATATPGCGSSGKGRR